MTKSRTLALGIAGLCAVSAQAFAQADATRFFVGVAAGGTRVRSDFDAQVARTAPSHPVPPTDASLDTDRVALRLVTGARILPRLAVEAEYADLGRVDSHVNWHGTERFSGPISIGRDRFERFGRIGMRTFALSLVGRAPVAPALSLFARAGVAYTRVEYQASGTYFIVVGPASTGSSPSPMPPKTTATHARPVAGLGIEYDLGAHWRARAEWARYFRLGDAYGTRNAFDERGRFDLDLVSLGIAYRF